MTLNFVKISLNTLKILCNNDKYNDEYILLVYGNDALSLVHVSDIYDDYSFYIDEYEDNDITFFLLKK